MSQQDLKKVYETKFIDDPFLLGDKAPEKLSNSIKHKSYSSQHKNNNTIMLKSILPILLTSCHKHDNDLKIEG